MLARPTIERAEIPALLLSFGIGALLLTLLGTALVVAWPRDATQRLVPVGRIGDLRPGVPMLVEVPPLPGAALPEIVVHDPANASVVYGRWPNPLAQKSPMPLYLVRTSPTEVVALLQVDIFSTCRIPWQPAERVFIDPCYSSTYTVDGTYIRGPARTGMIRFPVTISRSGVISVDARGAAPAPSKPQ